MDATFKLLRVRVSILQAVSRFLPVLHKLYRAETKRKEAEAAAAAGWEEDGADDIDDEADGEGAVLMTIMSLLFKHSEAQVFTMQQMVIKHRRRSNVPAPMRWSPSSRSRRGNQCRSHR